MNEAEKLAAARDLLGNPLAVLLIDEMEKEAIDRIIHADPKDDDTRAAYAAEARAIRNFRRTLNLLSQEATERGSEAPA